MIKENEFLKDMVKNTFKGSTKVLTQGEDSQSKDKSEESQVHTQVKLDLTHFLQCCQRGMTI